MSVSVYICMSISEFPGKRFLICGGNTLKNTALHCEDWKPIIPVHREDYLAFVHDLPLKDYIQPDPDLNAALERLPSRKLIFTNADSAHARRVMDVLGVTGFFDGIVDINDMDPYCKPMPESFQRAMLRAEEVDPGQLCADRRHAA